jgi:hypothetical protein
MLFSIDYGRIQPFLMGGGKTVQQIAQESVPRYNKQKISFAGCDLIYLNAQTIRGVKISLLRDIVGIGSAPLHGLLT